MDYIAGKTYLCTAFQGKHIMIGLWCNGSTTGFGSVCLGSNPGKPTEKEQWNPLLFFCLNNSRHVIFPIPLFVAIAPLFLPYILLCKTQGRSVNTFDDRNREVCVFLLLFVASAIGEVARSARGEVREKIYVVISVRCSIRTEYRAYIRYGFSTLAGRGCWFGCQDVLPSRGEILHR